MSEQKKSGASARFSARYVPALAKFRPTDFFPHCEGLQIEPHPEKGVSLFVTDGAACAYVRDPEGFASEPLVITFPEALAQACRRPEIPVPFDVNGDPYEGEVLPPWLIPATVDVMVCPVEDAARNLVIVVVHALERPPSTNEDMGWCLYHGSSVGNDPKLLRSNETRLIDRKLLPWSRIFSAPALPMQSVVLDPDLFALAAAFDQRSAIVSYHGEEEAVIFDLMSHYERDKGVEIKVGVMPMKRFDQPEPPTAVAPPAAETE